MIRYTSFLIFRLRSNTLKCNSPSLRRGRRNSALRRYITLISKDVPVNRHTRELKSPSLSFPLTTTAKVRFSGSQGEFPCGGNRKSTRRFNLVLFPYLSEIKPAIPFTNRYLEFNLCRFWCGWQELNLHGCPQEPETCASANFATSAKHYLL